ncbi:MAG: alcohol dehydrogenase [Chloroflexota bacterium]
MVKAAVMYEVGAPLKVEEVDLLDPGPGEVLVRMAAAGVCHSDWSVLQGKIPIPVPAVLGHEGAGVVAKTGPGVTAVQPGDKVIISWRAHCGRCFYCVRGRPILCEQATRARFQGTLLDGTTRFKRNGQAVHHMAMASTFAEYTVIPETGAVKIRPDAPLEKVAVVGCAVITGVGAVTTTADVEVGATVAVFGCGGVGLSAVQGAVLCGASKIIAVDVLDPKLKLAGEVGATHLINAGREDPVARIRELTGGEGVDYAFEVIGNPEVMAQAFEATRRGGTLVVVGVADRQARFAISPFDLVLQEKRVLGSLYGSLRPSVDIPRLVDLCLEDRIKLEPLITREVDLSEINDAFQRLVRGEAVRSIVRFGG